ncbi:hypothetical protein [Brucella endophytica]|nr:hypothetical protein [Brucella endophytica]
MQTLTRFASEREAYPFSDPVDERTLRQRLRASCPIAYASALA